jgi:hypothetical protein
VESRPAVTHRKRRKEIWEALHPIKPQRFESVFDALCTDVETGGKTVSTCLSDGRKAGPQHEQGFAASTAAAAGMTKQAINQHLARAEAPAVGLFCWLVLAQNSVPQSANSL